MNPTGNAIKVKARLKSSRAWFQTFQAELLLNHTYEVKKLRDAFMQGSEIVRSRAARDLDGDEVGPVKEKPIAHGVPDKR